MARKTALITGASRGIGFAIANELSKNGFDIIIFDVLEAKEAKAEIEKNGAKCFTYIVDISSTAGRKEAIEKIKKDVGKLDLLVNNAGVAPKERADILVATEESFDRVININLKGMYFLTQLVANWMIELKKKGNINPQIVNISSNSSYTSSTGRGEYCISKAGVSMVTKLYADRLAEFNIPVFEIRPGIIATDMTKGVKDKYDKMINEGLTPIKRWGLPEDIAKAVLAIGLGYFSFSTGEVINVDGGFHLRRL